MSDKKPKRALRLTLLVDADTAEDLVHVLRDMADRIAVGDMGTGVQGGVHSGACYELLRDPEMTHERYFEDLRAYLDRERAAATPDAMLAAERRQESDHA